MISIRVPASHCRLNAFRSGRSWPLLLSGRVTVLGLMFCPLQTLPSASSGQNLTVARSSFGDRVVEVVTEGAGDQRVAMRQDGGRFQIEANGHEVTITEDGVISVDGVKRLALASRSVRILINTDHIELRPGD